MDISTDIIGLTVLDDVGVILGVLLTVIDML